MHLKMPFTARVELGNVAPHDPSSGFREGDEIAGGRHVVRLLGGGVRFEAYLAWDDQLLALVVARMLRPDQVGEPVALPAIAAEPRVLESLQHPVIVRAFDGIVDGARPHLLLEYLDGPHLSTLLRPSAISIEQVLALGLQLCSGVHYVSTQDVVHMDVKPRNVIMTGPPRLLDFSFARRTDELARVSSPRGSRASARARAVAARARRQAAWRQRPDP